MSQMHLLIWSISLICYLLPLSTNSIGAISESNARWWCYLGGDPFLALVWFLVTQVFVLLSCFAIMIYIWIALACTKKQISNNTIIPSNVSATSTRLLSSAIDAIKLYPLSLIIVWAPNMVVLCLLYVNRTGRYLLYVVVSILATQNGTLLAGIYFMRSRESRLRLYIMGQLVLVVFYWLLTLPCNLAMCFLFHARRKCAVHENENENSPPGFLGSSSNSFSGSLTDSSHNNSSSGNGKNGNGNSSLLGQWQSSFSSNISSTLSLYSSSVDLEHEDIEYTNCESALARASMAARDGLEYPPKVSEEQHL